MKILITNTSADPIYEQIKNELKRQIITGELKDGEALPSIRKLALDLQISVITTKRAYDDLEKEGLISSVAGRGTFVAAKNKDLLREKKMKLIESKLTEVVSAAKMLGIEDQELKKTLSLLLRED
jgi:GntR family transcriptional regulator